MTTTNDNKENKPITSRFSLTRVIATTRDGNRTGHTKSNSKDEVFTNLYRAAKIRREKSID